MTPTSVPQQIGMCHDGILISWELRTEFIGGEQQLGKPTWVRSDGRTDGIGNLGHGTTNGMKGGSSRSWSAATLYGTYLLYFTHRPLGFCGTIHVLEQPLDDQVNPHNGTDL